MKVLELLKHIWQSGADVKLNGEEVDLVNYENTPKEIIEFAQKDVESIRDYLLSWKDASAIHKTMQKIISYFCGWQHNEKINEWLCNDDESLFQFHDWTVMLAENGWVDIYEDFRKFETEDSFKLATELYEKACARTKRGAAN